MYTIEVKICGTAGSGTRRIMNRLAQVLRLDGFDVRVHDNDVEATVEDALPLNREETVVNMFVEQKRRGEL